MKSDKSAKQKNKPLDLSHLTPEEIAKQVLETPPERKGGEQVREDEVKFAINSDGREDKD